METESLNTSSPNKSFEYHIFFALTLFAFGYFLFRLIFFATHIAHYIPPDEISHFGLCRIFSGVLFLPENSEKTYQFGLVTHIPYLYYYVMGKLINLNFFPVSDLVFLRLSNCILSFITVIYGYKWIKLITSNQICHILFIFLITNTSMFSFLGGSVNYDNLTNLFAAMSIYYLHLFFQNPAPDKILFFIISLLGGTLTKITFLPLLSAYLLSFIFHEHKHLRNISSIIKNISSAFQIKEKILAAIFILLFILNINLYLPNLIQFGKIVPQPQQVLAEKDAMKYRITAQYIILEQYKSGKLTFEEAVKKAETIIQHPGDLDEALYFLNQARENIVNPKPFMDRISYTWIWLNLMLQRSTGIAGHIFMVKTSYWFAVYQLIFLVSFFLFIRYWNVDSDNGYMGDALFLCLFYGIILVQLVNYPAYTQNLSVSSGLQGRYFFPVLIPFYGIVSYFLINPFKKPFQVAICLFISVFFIWGDFPYFLQHATSVWFFR